MKCVVLKACWPDADTYWKSGSIVDATPAQYALLKDFLKRATEPKVEKVVKDGADK